MKKGFLSVLGAVLGLCLIVGIIIGTFSIISGRKSLLQRAEMYRLKSDSAEVKIKVLTRELDSLKKANQHAELLYLEQIHKDKSKINQYRIIIEQYEQDINNIINLSDSALLNKIAGYYKGKY